MGSPMDEIPETVRPPSPPESASSTKPVVERLGLVSTAEVLLRFREDWAASSSLDTNASTIPDVRYLKDEDKRRATLRNWGLSAGQVNPSQTAYGRFKHYFSNEIHRPTGNELVELVQEDFPYRASLPVQVFDFGSGQAERHIITLGNIEEAMHTKPAWAVVRWIHAPLGIGLYHSSVEDLFFMSGSKSRGRPFERAGRPGWPILETEMLNMRDFKTMKRMRQVAHLLRKDSLLSDSLDKSVFNGDNNSRLKEDIEWRARHLKMGNITYSETMEADISWYLSETSSINMRSPCQPRRRVWPELKRQSLQKHPFYKNAMVARDCFRCFTRDDGYLLTLSSAKGIDYVNDDFTLILKNPPKDFFRDTQSSVIAHVFETFSDKGVDTWHRKNVEWFLIYLITEISATPHTLRRGFNVPSVLDAYDSIIHELKEGKFDAWKRGETVKLVRSHLACIDELKFLSRVYAGKLDFLQRLREDCRKMEASETQAPDNPSGVTMDNRIDFAIVLVEEVCSHIEKLVNGLNESMNSLFQLRSIEQNELAIVADSQSKAVFVFTGVTIIFLPLSFFTSYYGMNIQGIINTNTNQMEFWRLCGTLTFGIVCLVSLYAFRQNIHDTMVRRRMPGSIV